MTYETSNRGYANVNWKYTNDDYYAFRAVSKPRNILHVELDVGTL